MKDDRGIWIFAVDLGHPCIAPYWKKVFCTTHQELILIGYFDVNDEPDAQIELCPRCEQLKVKR